MINWKSLAFTATVAVLLFSCAPSRPVTASADTFIYGDPLPDAPALAARGEYKIGVRTIDLVNKGQIDILQSKNGTDPLYDRRLRLEVWYPATVPAGQKELTDYEDVFGSTLDSTRPLVGFTFRGRALRGAAPVAASSPFPLVIVSHGYPGSRVLLTYLTENLASKGYVVVAIDHTESTHKDQNGFASTLLNRSGDILFVLNQMAETAKAGDLHFLAGLVDANNTALIGYSMGGYGVLNVAGAGYSQKLAGFFSTIAGGSKAIAARLAANADYQASTDPRIKAVVAFAPWGMQQGVWDATGLKELKVPTFFIAGSEDDISGYEKGTKAIYDSAVNADRYLLTYLNARHNIAPNPPHPSLDAEKDFPDYYHYAEPAWDQRRINNINQHFITAFIGTYCKQKDFTGYLNLVEKPGTKPWTGFRPRTCVGLELRHAPAIKE